MPPIGILLCGGSASRFGADKLLAGADAIAPRAARNLIEGAGEALAVVPPGHEALSRALEAAGCRLLETDRTALGMGSSLAAAVEAAASADGWIVALGDMPFIAPATFAAVAKVLREGALIAAPVHRASNARGHPVGFSRSLYDEMAALDGDEGARSVIQAHRDDVLLIPVDDAGITRDVDRPSDLT